ncbi:MAG: hypothetical protein J6Q84_07830 [Kiritimatiellae bacterium]|jgi:hypothetical protein|nr:hypothetical protein [Kiritimatiellia bacterium]
MRKNKKISKRMSRLTVNMMHLGAIMLTFFVMVVLNLMASSSCSQLTKIIADKEKQLADSKVELSKNIVRWDSVKSSVNLERALVVRGMSMNYPKSNQIVRMDERGRVIPSQNSVAVLRRKKQEQERSTASFETRRPYNGIRRVIR